MTPPPCLVLPPFQGTSPFTSPNLDALHHHSTPPFTPRASSFASGTFSRIPSAEYHADTDADHTLDQNRTADRCRTPTQDMADTNEAYNESPNSASPNPGEDLKINIPHNPHSSGQNSAEATPSVPRRKSTVERNPSKERQQYVRPKHNPQPSFHSRENHHIHNEYNSDHSRFFNPNHYSSGPNSYHRKSVSGMSTRSNTTIGDVDDSTSTAGADSHHDQHRSHHHSQSRSHSQHSEHHAHARGPTGLFERAHSVSGASQTKEETRLDEDTSKERYWKRWGPYLAERQWATVREDYSANGDAWSHFPHEHARSRAFRWGEDGIGGFSDNKGRLNFSLALWNGKDRMLKERLFGLANNQGNHGEDVKELYYYLDNTPTHSYMKYLYKYPQAAFPYEQLVRESQNRGRDVAEFEITDTDLFDEDRYWDVFVEYAKDDDEENAISIRISAYNRGPDPADLHIIPQLFFRNTWSWPKQTPPKPELKQVDDYTIETKHETLGQSFFYASTSPAPSYPPKKRGAAPEPVNDEEVAPVLMFTENETNLERLYNVKNVNGFAKDAFHDQIIIEHRLEKDRAQAVKKTRTVPKTVKKMVKGPSTPRARQNDGDKKLGAKPANDSDSPSQDNGEETPIHGSDNGDAETGNGAHPDEDEEEEHEVEEEIEVEEEYWESPDESSPSREYVNPNKVGTKAAAQYVFSQVPGGGGCAVVRIKLTPKTPEQDPAINDDEAFDNIVDSRRAEADEFYGRLAQGPISDDMKSIMRQALAGMLWNKQFYTFIQSEWIQGDPGQPAPPPERKYVRNREWRHLHMEDVLSMPDKWEYPFSAVWDTAFHCIPLSMVDPAFAKKQLDLFTREWYMKPDGALPAYEWNFSDVNPPVHAWATFRVFKIERKMYGREDLDFLERVFQKLLINFTWWVNRKDSSGSNVFEGGFLGLDNIGPFNRSEPLPTGGTLRQADGTAWMAFYALNMLNMALELAKHNPTYEDIASKFFEHFIFISDAMTYRDGADDEGVSLWSEKDGFYYDAIQWGPNNLQLIPVKSLVGLIPLYATLTLEPSVIKRFPSFAKRMQWFMEHRSEMSERNIANMKVRGRGDRSLLAMVSRERLEQILKRMLDETEFLSTYGIRSLSKYHKDHPFQVNVKGEDFGVSYWPGDSHSPMFGGNSNWRGPIWLAVNFLIIESLQRFYQFYGEDFKIECPSGSGDFMHLGHVAEELQHRMINLFSRDEEGRRPCNGGVPMLDYDPNFRDLVQFHEFFNGDNGKGLGASHQCGWTGVIAYSIMSAGQTYRLPRTPRTPRSTAAHYFDEIVSQADTMTDVDGKSEAGGSVFSSYSASWSRPPSPDEL
ncbi:hypothetical protein OC846_004424 [Tilletia horrida]|uniref:Glycosyl hydrolase family 63 C-terminal domain-containing protein n=1 Tax=Tilletia horrida TaxID=155126 RepID=A0AAN6GPP8_9BASI|nr:hypothetical protein OC845_005083 [Tilletia horrida]KAK0548594.1 hypothetical protein OC846_004424 [Tilletia horrida]